MLEILEHRHVPYLRFSGGCFQAPTCIDQSNYNMTDIHEEGAELFTMIVPNATDQFSGHTFNDLFFSIVNSDLDIFNINSVTGKYTDANKNASSRSKRKYL